MLLSESDDARRRSFADVLIRPDFEGVGILEFHMLDDMRAVGPPGGRRGAQGRAGVDLRLTDSFRKNSLTMRTASSGHSSRSA